MLVFGFLAALQALAVVGAATLQKRTNDFINAIAEPTAGTVIQPGQTFPFQYVGGSRCNLLYTGVRIYIFPDQPTLSDFDDNGVPVVSYLYSYGEYVHINIGERGNVSSTA
ncbi:hypothetical protein BC835DRAFT_1339381 [Cytidiella melzeri]|nr:hypothetical protein BC835DRAFT_1339381 [Cytidiella melzeri]